MFLAAILALFFATPAFSAEQINRFDVLVEVETSGDVIVTETLDINAEGQEIQRGIFRDLPGYFEQDGQRYRFDYEVLSITRDGNEEPYEAYMEGNAYRIRIGDPDVFLEYGRHIYELRYRVANQVRYFPTYDEVYWNVTGNYWPFPILEARAVIQLPREALIIQTAGYTGVLGATGNAFTYAAEGNRHIFQATRPLQANEGLTVAVGFEKGVIDPPSAADQADLWWQSYGALLMMGVTIAALLLFFYVSWLRVGRDPPKSPIFPRYEAPPGLSPAAAHHIMLRGTYGARAAIATLVNLAIKGRLTIDASNKTAMRLTSVSPAPNSPDISEEDLALEREIFDGQRTRTLGGGYDAAFTAALANFQQKLYKKYGHAYFRWNLGYTIFAILASLALFGIAMTQVVTWTMWHGLALFALLVTYFVFGYLMPAATVKGDAAYSGVRGLHLYMSTAEKMHLNAVAPEDETPPTMTKERYERFLPYAIALGVEDAWTSYFQRVLPQEANDYSPAWSSGRFTGTQSFSSALLANMSSGVSSAAPQASGSGSGGGGSSGGGGGGGGGGGW